MLRTFSCYKYDFYRLIIKDIKYVYNKLKQNLLTKSFMRYKTNITHQHECYSEKQHLLFAKLDDC